MFSLFRARRTICEMLEDRGYDVSDQVMDDFVKFFKASQNCSIEEFRESLEIIAKKKSGSIFVGFPNNANIKIDHINAFKTKLEGLKINHAIFVIQDKITSFSINSIKNLKTQKINIEIFKEIELQFNVTKHDGVPKYVVCTEEKKQEFLKQYNTTAEKCPKMKIDDPIARYFGAGKGTMMKVISKSTTMPFIKLDDDELIEFKTISARIVE